jgi:hypothetical protein
MHHPASERPRSRLDGFAHASSLLDQRHAIYAHLKNIARRTKKKMKTATETLAPITTNQNDAQTGASKRDPPQKWNNARTDSTILPSFYDPIINGIAQRVQEE